MGDFIGKKEKESFDEMEKRILGNNNGVKYSRDLEFEISIKHSVLCEKYGKDKVEKYLIDNNIILIDLDDHDLYIKASKELKSI